MMKVGASSDFAIEAYHEPYSPQWAGFGRIAIDVRSVRIGQIHEEHCSLYQAMDRLRETASCIDEMWDETFDGLTDLEIFEVIDSACYTGDSDDCEKEYWAFDFLTNTGEQFDGYKAFLVCRPGGKVSVLYQLPDGTIGSGECSAETYCSVARSIVRWFDAEVAAGEGNSLPGFRVSE